MSSSYITEEELTITRTPKDLRIWLEQKFKDIAKSPGGKKSLYFPRNPLHKKLIEEIYPLDIFCQHKFGNNSNVFLSPVIGNQSYDALICEKTYHGTIETKLEITQANEGENDYLRKRELHRYGHVWGMGKVIKSGTKNTGIKLTIEPPEFSSYLDHTRHVLDILFEAIKRKSDSRYDSSTSLLAS